MKKLRPESVKGLPKGHRESELGSQESARVVRFQNCAFRQYSLVAWKSWDKTKTAQLGPRPRARIELPS